MRSLAPCALLWAVSCAWGADLPETVTLPYRTATLDQVGRDLAQALGVKIEIAPDVAREVVAVAWTGAKTEDALARLAKAVAAKWVTIEGGRRLAADPEARSAQARAWRDERKDRIERGIGQWGKRPDGPPDAKVAPGVMLPAEIARAVGADFLADLAPGARMVWSSAPTPRQRRLAPGMAAAVEKYLREARQEAKVPRPEGHPPYRVPDVATVLVDAWRGLAPDSQPSVRVRLFDHDGDNSFTTTISPFAELPKAPPGPKVDCEDRLDASAEMRPLMDLVSSIENSLAAGVAKLPAEWVAKHSDVRARDPLGWILGDFYRQSAARLGKNLVACIPDRLFDQSMLSQAAERPSVSSYLGRQSAKGMVVEVADGWLQATPARPACARAERLDRKALADLIGDSSRRGIASLDGLAAFAFATMGTPLEELKLLGLLLFVPGSTPALMDGDRPGALALYGALGPAQRAALRTSGGLAIVGLPPAARKVLESIVFGPSELRELGEEDPEAIESPGSFMGVFMRRSFAEGPASLANEPTVAMPQGFGPNAYLRAFGRSEPCFLAPDAPFGALSVLSLDDLVGIAAARESDSRDLAEMDGLLGSLKRLRLADSTLIRLRAVCRPGLGWEGDLSDVSLRTDPTIYSLENLPAAIAEMIKKRLEDAKRESEPPPLPPTSASGR